MVSMIQSNFRGHRVQGWWRTGWVLCSRIAANCSRSRMDIRTSINRKTTFQTIIPGFATKGGQPWLAFGVMGGDMQPQGQAQIIVNRVDYGLDVQAAGDSPRWHHEGSSQSMGEDPPGLGPNGLFGWNRRAPARAAGARRHGWSVGASDGGFGRYHCIERRMEGPNRVYAAASEMRADGIALAY